MDELALVRAQIKCLRGQQRYARKMERQAGLTARACLVALGCYVLSGFDPRVAVTFVKQQPRVHSDTDAAIQDLVETWFLEASDAAILALWYPETPWQVRVRSDACAFLAEYRTVQHIKDCNFNVGFAPGTLDVVETYATALHGFRDVASAAPLRSDNSRWARRWARKFRARWNLRFRCLKPHHDSEQELCKKAVQV